MEGGDKKKIKGGNGKKNSESVSLDGIIRDVFSVKVYLRQSLNEAKKQVDMWGKHTVRRDSKIRA